VGLIGDRSLCRRAISQLENGWTLVVVLPEQVVNDFRLSSVLEFIGRCLPAPACETVVGDAGVGHGEDVVGAVVEQRLPVELSVTCRAIVSVRGWVLLPQAASAVVGVS
jgi:hypothetical protein